MLIGAASPTGFDKPSHRAVRAHRNTSYFIQSLPVG
jgi:hypothetical protein